MIYRILTVLTPLITSPYLARALGVEALGKYSASQVFVNYFVPFAMLSIENYGNRTIARVQSDKKERTEIFGNIYVIQFIAACCSMLVYVVLVEILIRPELKLLYLLQGLWLISLLNINWFFWGCEQFKLTVTRNIVIKIASVESILLFVKNSDDLWIYVVIMGLSMVLAEGALWLFLPQYISQPKVQWNEIRKSIKPILQLFIPVLAFSVFHIMDKTMLNTFSNDANSGYYYNADKLINIALWKGTPSVYKDYEKTKANVLSLKPYINAHAGEKVLTHIDAVPDNFLFAEKDGREEIRLIDWEYAGMQDPHVDVAMFCIYSLYNKRQVDHLIAAYFTEGCSDETRTKIYCYIAACGLLWSNWCEYKRNLGVEFGEYSLRQYRYAKDYYRIVQEELKKQGEEK